MIKAICELADIMGWPYVVVAVLIVIMTLAIVIVAVDNSLMAPQYSWHEIDVPEDSGFGRCWRLKTNLSFIDVVCQ